MILDKKLPFKYIFKIIKYDLMAVLLVGLSVHYLSTEFRRFIPEMSLAIPAFLGTAISILLSFKMNQSYDRWWEARKVWGAMVNDSRTLVIQLQSFTTKDETEKIKTIAYRQISWCYSLGRSLRGINEREDHKHLMSLIDLVEIAKHKNQPLAILQLNAKDLKELRLSNKMDLFSHVHLDNTLTRLCDAMGKAERINGTVFPSSYRKFLHFFIYIFVITLSISLKDVSLVFEIPLLLVISVGFFLIEKSAYALQDPFKNRPSDIPVSAIARTIEINIRQLLGEKDVPEPVRSDDFYIL